MSSELTNDDLDDLEVELAQVEQTLRLLDDEAVAPTAAVEWLADEPVEVRVADDGLVADEDRPTQSAQSPEPEESGDVDDTPLAPVVELHNRTH